MSSGASLDAGDTAQALRKESGSLGGDIADNVPIIGSQITAGTARRDISQHHYTSASAKSPGSAPRLTPGVVLGLMDND